MRDQEQSNSWKQKTEWWLPGTGEEEMGSYCLNGYRLSVLQDEKGSGDWLHQQRECTQRNLTVHFEMVNMANFML